MSGDGVRCDEGTRRGRLVKARQFRETAELVATMADDDGEVLDACVTLLVHAGIAAADVVCCVRLGRHAQGQDHVEAVALLARVDLRLANDLKALLGMKTHAGYSAMPMTPTKHLRAVRAARRLVDAAVAL
jgi:hypothetical protein